MSRTDLDNFTFSDTVPPSEYDDTGGHEVVEAFNFMDIKGQDVTEPVWPDKPLEPPANDMPAMRAKHEHAGELRTAGGVLDFMGDVVDEVTDWIERDTMEGRAHRPSRKKDRPMSLNIFQRAAKYARCNSYAVSQPVKIVQERPERQRVIITNWSASAVYISHMSEGTGTLPPFAAANADTNTVQIAPNASRTFYSSAELWCYPQTGATQLVDVQDEYGWPDDDY